MHSRENVTCEGVLFTENVSPRSRSLTCVIITVFWTLGVAASELSRVIYVPNVSAPYPSGRHFSENSGLVLPELKIDLGSSFDLSVNRLGVLLHDETQVIVPRFLVEVDFWSGRDHFANLELLLRQLDICIGSWVLRDWLAAAFSVVFLIVLRVVSVAVLWLLCLLLALLFCLLFFSSLLQIFDALLAILVPLLLYYILLDTSSLAVVPCRILTTSTLAVVPFALLI